jgi:hypothetical protein
MSLNECRKLLAKLKAVTRTRAEDAMGLEVTMETYVENLASYPEDITRHVLTTHADGSPWWPTWAELRERLEVYARPRRALRAALDAKPLPPAPLPRPKEKPLSVAEILAKRNGSAQPAPALSLDPTPEQAARQLEKDRLEFLKSLKVATSENA